MEFTAENLERAVVQFYHTDAAMQAHAHHWLTTAQASPEAWSFVWHLLQPNKSAEVQFFAATTLHTKLIKSWHQVPPEQYASLKKQLLEAVASYCLGPKIVLNRLCIALSAYVLHTLPLHWPNAVPELLATFQPSNLPAIPPERTAWILLEILTVLPEETSHFAVNEKGPVRIELQKSIPQVLSLLENILATDTSTSNNETAVEVTHQAVCCAGSWLQLGVPLPDCEKLANHLVASIFASTSSPQLHQTGLAESALDALSNMLTHPDSHKYPSTCIRFLEKLLPLKQIIEAQQQQRDGAERDQELVSNIYGLFISFAESHSRLMLDSLLNDDYKINVLQLVQLIFQCSNSPGIYPIQENTSQSALGFWYILQDDIIASEPEQFNLYVVVLSPVYRALAEVMIHKSMLPAAEDTWSNEEKELLRCYRQDIADTMMYCYNILRENLLELLHGKLEEALEKCNSDPRMWWRYLESCLHAFQAVAECVDIDESRHLPRFLETLQCLPYHQLDTQVIITALEAVGAYAEWINAHPSVLSHVIPLLITGLGSGDLAPAATMALKDLTRDCQTSMAPFAHHILQASQEALRGEELKLGECVRLMYTVGRVLAVLPVDSIMDYLNQLLMPYVEELQYLVTHEPNAAAKAGILLRLKMLGMLFATLDIKPRSENDTEPDVSEGSDMGTSITTQQRTQQQSTGSGSGEQVQPVFFVLQRILPVTLAIVEKWYADAHVIQVVCSALRHALATLLDDCKPLVPEMLELLVKSYRLQLHPPALDLAKQFLILYGKDGSQLPLMKSLLKEVCSVTLMTCSGNSNTPGSSLSDHADILATFFCLLAQILKKNPQLFVDSEEIDLAALFQCGTLTLSLPEASAVNAATSFLVNFVSLSREVVQLLTVVQTCGEELVQRLLRCIGGESPRLVMEHLSDLLLALNKKHCDNLCRWLQQAIHQDGFPSVRVSQEQKEHFVKMVLKERANKRKLQETVREFSLICRGLVGTDYAAQSSHFF
ncbi:importin-13 isoform X2 [Zootermopsis nevadensis]|uniref:importin-13 isoform X2 n=1 Tax=Zootermopsis nevadensis TaxID=136037 RepID=UPI000B8EC0E5|nr:importin-13 isoform X2 [Zootermopsis nevadensis]